MKKIWLCLSVVFTFTFALADDCHMVLGVFDIGSGSTKAEVNLVNFCDHKIEKELIPSISEKVSYKNDLTQNDNLFSDQIVSDGLAAIQKLRKVAETNQDVVEELQKQNQSMIYWQGIATSAFRTSKNGEDTIQKFSDATQIRMQIISETIEAELGFISGSTCASNPEQAIVWDIGSGSQQLSYRNDHGELQIVTLENKGSDSVKNKIIHDVEKKSLKKVTTPNPIGQQNYKRAVREINKFFPDIMFGSITRRKEIIGIGGVHQASIPEATGKKTDYSVQDLSNILPSLINLDDEAIKNQYDKKYFETFVTNVILVQTVLTNKLHSNTVHICPYGIADGLTLNEMSWIN